MVNEIEGKRGMWRSRDTDGNDQFDQADYLLPLDGAGEHGPHLGSADRFVRFAARVALEHQPVSNWRSGRWVRRVRRRRWKL